ncbi:tyrosyl-DNA phosphodiesterase-domain-containing protein [Daedaleopsis nitida]|nr:tyrosyl-DNA phosphodiesterase-domain-containing protein [Daedaleopsis nitida]
MDDGYDSDIARAIALSLQDSGPPIAANAEVIDLSADEPDDDEARFHAEIQRAIEESKRQSAPAAPPAPAPAAATDPASAFRAERARLEAERLERQKRHRPDAYQSSKTVDLDESSDEEEQTRGAKRQRISPSSRAGARSANTHASSSSTAAANSSYVAAAARTRPSGNASGSGAQTVFWDGELRQTANAHVDPQKDRRPVFRLSEIISPKDDIEFAIVSAFCWNFPLIYQMFDPRTPVIAVDHSQAGDASIKAILPNWVRTTPFIRGGRGCMHMKFMLLFYKTGRLRIMISTANLVDYDWRDIENTVWVQDVPKLPAPVVADPKTEDFSSSMIRVLHAVNVAPALVNLLKNDHPNIPLQRLEDLRTQWDFSKVKAALIPSIAGKHEGWPKVILTGHTRLMKALIDMGGATPADKELVLECQGSSIGTYSTQWLNEFYCSARGESAQGWLDKSKASRTKLPFPPVKILFPSAQYVRESALGEAGGGTMFCRRNQWEGKNFPRELFHQTRSKRGKVLMHSKMILGTFRDKRGGLGGVGRRTATDGEDEDGSGSKLAGWAYVGSHNFTPSAWGTLSGSAFNPTLNITNYELGLLIPLHSQEEIDRVACWERPAQKYVLGRDIPWMQTESQAFAQ